MEKVYDWSKFHEMEEIDLDDLPDVDMKIAYSFVKAMSDEFIAGLIIGLYGGDADKLNEAAEQLIQPTKIAEFFLNTMPIETMMMLVINNIHNEEDE